MKTIRTFLVILMILLGVAVSATRAGDEYASQALQYYFDLLSTENFESASQLWTPEAQERSSRFGITYKDIPVRPDATSPCIRELGTMKYFLQPAVKQSVNLKGAEWVRLEFSNVVNNRLVTWYYYANKRGDYYWLAYPQDYYSAGWPVVESKYFRIHAHPDKQVYLNQAVLEEADAFVEHMADSLHLDKASLADVGKSKIEYYYCPGDSLVKEITGQATKGILDLASNDIISADFPHFHEIVHLLINVKLKDAGLVTLPLIREGIAVRYGGRWGKRATALLELGVFLYREKLVEIDSILTVQGFDASASADIAYPVAGLFASYLLEKLGQPKYFELYRSVSQTDNSLDSLNHLEVRKALVGATGAADWTAFLADFDAYVTRVSEQVGLAQAGGGKKGSEVLKGNNFVATRDGDWICFEFDADTSGEVQGNVLFDLDPRLAGKRSHLFEEQYGMGQPFEGYRFGIRYDKNEAGLYDYATNELVAKYIFGISPSKDYFDESNKRIRIKFKSKLFGDTLQKGKGFQVLPM